MRPEGSGPRTGDRLHRSRTMGLMLPLLLGGCALCLFSGCATRASNPTVAPDSTLVYPSRLEKDVNASIAFSLKDSKKRDEARKLERDRIRELTRRRKSLEQEIKADSDGQIRAAKEAMAAKEMAAKHGKKHKKKRAESAPDPGRTEQAAGAILSPEPNPALLAQLQSVQDSLAQLENIRDRRLQNLLPEERTFDLEEGARVVATFKLDSPRARGDRPILFHVLWVNPDQKAAFRKLIEFAPTDSAGEERSSLSSSFTISPTKRAPGRYCVRLYMFRELMAEKRFDLRGEGLGPEESDEGKGQM